MTLVAAILCASVCVLAGRLALRERRRAKLLDRLERLL